MENIVQSEIFDKFAHKAKTTRALYKVDIGKFVKEYGPKRLFHHIPGRNHRSFPNFVHTMALPNSDKLRQRLKKYSKVLDKERNILL